MKSNKRRGLLIFIIVLLLSVLLTQLQPALLHALGAVDGTFGLRPVSHKCAGLTLAGTTVARGFPSADWQGRFGFFSIRYLVPPEALGRDFCLGQDVWFGE
jgi:hypothetical protein